MRARSDRRTCAFPSRRLPLLVVIKPAQVFASGSGGAIILCAMIGTGRGPQMEFTRAPVAHRGTVGGDGPWDAGLASCTAVAAAAAAGSPYMELHYTRRDRR